MREAFWRRASFTQVGDGMVFRKATARRAAPGRALGRRAVGRSCNLGSMYLFPARWRWSVDW
ncbi:MAG TPA: hypothetical protein VKV96_21805, partial [Roseiarcus sp.]|nr:hypothetical protein [Roseiarcus sp.]